MKMQRRSPRMASDYQKSLDDGWSGDVASARVASDRRYGSRLLSAREIKA